MRLRPADTENQYPCVSLRSAWLITWMGTEPWAWSNDWRSIMAIISGRRSRKFIEDVLWLLAARAYFSGYGMAYYANRRRDFGLPYWDGPGIRFREVLTKKSAVSRIADGCNFSAHLAPA